MSFGLVFDLMNPFFYDPTKGNLLLDINVGFTTLGGFPPQFSRDDGTSGVVSRAWDGAFGSPGADTLALRTLFTTVDLAEPGTLGLLALGFVGAASMRRRKLA